jgi:hypothetical protein
MRSHNTRRKEEKGKEGTMLCASFDESEEEEMAWDAFFSLDSINLTPAHRYRQTPT